MTKMTTRTTTRIAAIFFSLALLGAACSSDSDDAASTATEASESEAVVLADGESNFEIEVWADNWMAVYVDGVLIGEDSVPITTERSFNAETFTFQAAYPFTLAIEAKDFKETDSGIEYIGEGNQQMGDGGLIAQVTDTQSGTVVAASDSDWAALVVHRAPLNTECEKDSDPNTSCEFEITETPADWAASGYDSSGWTTATEWSSGDVGPKDGYDEIDWDSSAQLIWGTDLEVDNTVLFRTTVTAGG
ncbi:MAG: PEBP family protein [Acidimicrobiales bacterium]